MSANVTAVGIDLGTTYSAVAILDEHGHPEILPCSEGERLVPSAVFFDNDQVVVGQIAKDAAITDPDNVVLFIKRQMGMAGWHYSYQGQSLTPTDISAFILKKLKKDAEQALDHPITHAVVTVPAYFDPDRRRATQSAAEIAGFKVLTLLNEPTAAAIAFGVERATKPETVLVYDLGGGTFDVTLMRVEGKEITILATDGDHQLGGKDFDDALMRFCVQCFREEHGFDPTDDPHTEQMIRKDAEKLKRELSVRTKTALRIAAQGHVSRIEIERERFESLIKVKIDITLALVRTLLQEQKMRPEVVDRVLLIGGSTRIPAVRAALHQYFGKPPDTSINPDEAVAHGAALMAAKKINELYPESVSEAVAVKTSDLMVADVTSHSLGIATVQPGNPPRRYHSILIQRNSPIPAESSRDFLTSEAGATVIKVTVYRGESTKLEDCSPVGEFTLSGLPPNRPPGKRIRVTVACGENGLVQVSAIDIETGLQAQTEVSYQDGQNAHHVSARQRWMQSQKVE